MQRFESATRLLFKKSDGSRSEFPDKSEFWFSEYRVTVEFYLKHMDFERGAEFLPQKPQETESGYSEKESAQVIEGSLMDMKTQKKRKPVQITSRKEKIVIAYRNNLQRILNLVESIAKLEGINHRQEEQIVEEIKNLRRIQEELLNALILEQKGVLSEESISKDAWSLIV